MTIPEFANEAEAAEAGYLVRLPRTEEYRGWLILTDYKSHRIRICGRQRSGAWAVPETPQPLIRVGMAGTVRMNRTMPSGRYMKFRWAWLPHGGQPREDLISIADRTSRVGHPMPLGRYAHRSEWERARAELCRLVDVRVDGRANLDLIED